MTHGQHEFKNKLIASIRYEGLKLITDTETRMKFKTFEIVEGADGTVNDQGVEMLLELEPDG